MTMQNKKLNIGLIGYGKMGKTIEKLAVDKTHTIGLKCTSANPLAQNLDILQEIDLAIEFTNPEKAAQNLKILAEHKIPTVCGSTGWLNEYDSICAQFNATGTPFLYASNFSVGVNVFFSLNKHLARLMDKLDSYGVQMMESHHLEKKDAPSGTAVSLAEGILDEMQRKQEWHLGTDDKANSIPIEAVREADVKGLHEIRYTNDVDQILIRHEAFSRIGFASGALLAAEWIYGRSGIFSMSDVLEI